MFDVVSHLPSISAMKPGDLDSLDWKGLTRHVGPLSDFTPLQKSLLGKTNCSLYMIYIGCVGFYSMRTAPVIEQLLNRCLSEQIFCYQFDWRYPDLFDLPISVVDDKKDRQTAIRRAPAYYFFKLVDRMPSFFQSNKPIADVSFMINLTRHILGKENDPVFGQWVAQMIERMDKIAASVEVRSSSLYDYSSREEWEAAALLTHGQPLPLEVLNPGFEPEGKDLHALAVAEFNSISPADNPLLATPEVLLERGFEGTPYRLAS